VFKDLLIRTPSKWKEEQKVDKVTFFEYCQLPGIILDRFYHLFDKKDTGSISEACFINTLIPVFISDLDAKMHLTFDM